MSGVINGNQRCCGTCELWSGLRRLNSDSEVKWESSSAKCIGGGNNNTYIDAYGNCSQYRKWSKLR